MMASGGLPPRGARGSHSLLEAPGGSLGGGGRPDGGSDGKGKGKSKGKVKVKGPQRATPAASAPETKKEEKGKGLRHFSMKVCAKVELKGTTTYNEVADELVTELMTAEGSEGLDEKPSNIRRRVYDALNVLRAMGIISKEKKEIQWNGLPNMTASDIDRAVAEKLRVHARLEKKRQYLQDLAEQHGALESLLERNRSAWGAAGPPRAPAGGAGGAEGAGAGRGGERGAGASSAAGRGGGEVASVSLPFLVVHTKPDTEIEVRPSEDGQLVELDFNAQPFAIHDETFVLQNMVSEGVLKPAKRSRLDG